MVSDKIIYNSYNQNPEFDPLTFYDILFTKLAHRPEHCCVINSHIGERLISLTLNDVRHLTRNLTAQLRAQGLKYGDTMMLASFSCSNELTNVLIFAAAASVGIRVFIPIFPEPSEFVSWKQLTGFSHVIMPYREMLDLKEHAREKEIVNAIKAKCNETGVSFLDSNTDFKTFELIDQVLNNREENTEDFIRDDKISPDTEMVIFTTSGTSGKSKLVVYSHKSFAFCCQAWHESGLFAENLFGNTGFSPLFTHTIGIRTFINCLWSGNPYCLIVTDWFLTKPAVISYFLLKMHIGHIIAGPAFFNTMLELFRQFPELKSDIQHSLQAAISIGAPFDNATSAKFKSATGVPLMNGFGTTETLMVSLNNSSVVECNDPRNIGKTLPGVTLRLKSTDEDNLYELEIQSVFQSVRTIGEISNPDFFETGDLVSYDENSGQIMFHGRKSSDFIKDEYGVKIPLTSLKEYYKKLLDLADWIEWIPLVNIPGLAAMIFMSADENVNRQKELAAIIKSTNEKLKLSVEPFEYAHRHLERFTIINDEVPLTRKGTVSKDQIYKKYEQIITDLRNPYVFNQSIELTETGDKSDLYKFSNPYLAELLEALKIDRKYIKGEGDYLFYQDGSSLQKVTDFVGGFGANLLGHNHPKIKDAAIKFLDSGFPALNNQGSQYHYPSLLARELNRLFGESTGKYFKVMLGNSGTEATELAIHHAYFEWRNRIEKIREEQFQLYGSIPGLPIAEVWDKNMEILDQSIPSLIVANDCFHGYTSGSRSLLNNNKKRNLFTGLLRPKPLHVNDSVPDWNEQVLRYIGENSVELQVFQAINGDYLTVPLKLCTIIASIIEPVRGEGGIHEINPLFADFLAVQDFPLISDEIQCGLGRTGNFPAYSKASYYLLGKSLGGGIEKISAVLIDGNRFKTLFSKYYNSTFANGELAAAVALGVLNVIEEENVVATAKNKGNTFLGLLRELAAKHPGIIESIDGTGLMIGIHFDKRLKDLNLFFRVLVEHELLGYFFAGWFLNNHNIRVLPSLSKPNSLRIEPSYLLPDNEMLRLCDALDELCQLCTEKRMYQLFLYLMNGDIYSDKKYPVFDGEFPQQLETPAPDAIKVGFIGNFTISHRELQLLEPDFRQASDTGMRILFDRLQVLLQGKPVKVMAKNFMNGKIHFIFYTLPFDTSHLEIISRWGKKRYYISKIQEAVNLLTAESVECISLGAHTSIISGNGLFLAERGTCRILTGNSLTVASCLYNLDQYLNAVVSQTPIPYTIAVVGASGNIGTGLVECLNDNGYSRHNLILVSNNEKRLQRLVRDLKSNNINVSVTSDLFELKKADVIICCVNTNDAVIFSHHVNDSKPVFIIDISVPNAVSEDVKNLDNVIFCKEASSVYMAANPEIVISTHTPKGKIFCCAGETILYAIHKLNLPMKGHIHKESVRELLRRAEKEGFFNREPYEATV
jgi:acetylornithine/succinyldiaminopimelate/putrescine aminotransferase/long-subunit acyl-CoA synthetase (AMP-forming)/predicted amino acid dehydrogenase